MGWGDVVVDSEARSVIATGNTGLSARNDRGEVDQTLAKQVLEGGPPVRTPAAKAIAKPLKVAPAAKQAAAPARPSPEAKPKLVRDSFTMPRAEYAAIEQLKRRASVLERPAKKIELLRAGIKALSNLSDEALLAALRAVPTIKTGRPKH